MSGCLLYLISPPVIHDLEAFAASLEAVLSRSADIIGAFQLRLKALGSAQAGRLTDVSADEASVLAASARLRPLCQVANVPFLVNDHAGLARAVVADGVHIGQEDAPLAEARAALGPEAIIGVSCHASRHLAMEAAEAGADYITFGAFYPTTSKTREAQAYWGQPGPELLRWWSTYTTVPCVAIGGITTANAPPLIEGGADFLAVITAIWDHPEGAVAAVEGFRPLLALKPG